MNRNRNHETHERHERSRMDEGDDLTKLADAAFEQAALNVVERARRFGTPVIIWRDGQIKNLRPQDIEIHHRTARESEGEA